MKSFMGLVLSIAITFNGCGGGSDDFTPELGSVFKEVSIENVIQVESAFGFNESNYLLKSDGTVYLLGSGFDNAVQISGLVNIKKIAVGYSGQILALDHNGDVYVFGANSGYELGLDHRDEVLTPEKNPYLSDIIDIASGLDMSIAVKDDGTVYSWGHGYNGALGYEEEDYQQIPKEITGLSGIKKIDCGYSHAVALDENGDVYSWGEGANGRLGLGDTNNYTTPQQITDLSEITDISTGYDYTLVLNSSKDVYGFGNGTDGKLSLSSNSYTDEQTTPAQATGVDNISQISAGYNHSLFLNTSGDVYSSGRNSDSSKLGYGNNNYGKYSLNQATKIPGLSKQSYVNAGNDNSVFVDNSGKVTVTQEQPITYPEPDIGSSACGGFVGNWTRGDGVTLNVSSSCSAIITQQSTNTASVMKTYLSNINGDGKTMGYTIVKMEMDGYTQNSGNSYSGEPYSVSGNELNWGGYTYTK